MARSVTFQSRKSGLCHRCWQQIIPWANPEVEVDFVDFSARIKSHQSKHWAFAVLSLSIGLFAGTHLAHGQYSLSSRASFDGTNGSEPLAGVIANSSGNLFGTAYTGGSYNQGVLFELPYGSDTIAPVVSFTHVDASHNIVPGGASPHGGLIAGSNSDFYGTTTAAGATDNGTIFRWTPGSASVTQVASFNFNSTGAYPYGNLVSDSSGNLYGTAIEGGNQPGITPSGTVFEWSKQTDTLSEIAVLNFGGEGYFPRGGLATDGLGNLYGVAEYGLNSSGALFEVSAQTHALTYLAPFSSATGGTPYGGLVVDSAGDVFGTTSAGGTYGDGTIFEFSATTKQLSALAQFDGINGANPKAGLITDPAGNLYGTTFSGGADNDGTIFEYNLNTQNLSTLALFDGTDGANPEAGLFADASGDLFGTTYAGGTYDDGTVFELLPTIPIPEPSVGGIIILAICIPSLRRYRCCVF
jgi:uncharacterized repeat protein (TIGR03803 family)